MGGLGITRRLHHRLDGIAEDLNAYGTLEFLEIQLLDTLHRIADETVGGDELRINHIGAKHLADIAERRI